MTTLSIVVPPPFDVAIDWRLVVDGEQQPINTVIELEPGVHRVSLAVRVRQASLAAAGHLTLDVSLPLDADRTVHIPLPALMAAWSKVSRL